MATEVSTPTTTQTPNDPVDPWAALRRAVYGVDAQQHGWTTLDEVERLATWLHAAPGTRLLDVGCGAGGLSALLAGLTGSQVIGTDLAPGGAGHVAPAPRPGSTQLVRADATASLPFGSGAFDALCCIDAVPHLVPIERVLLEWRRLLATSESPLVIIDPTVPSSTLPALTPDEATLRTGPVAYEMRTTEELLAALEGAGFERCESIDLTDGLIGVAQAWRDGVERDRSALERTEGREAVDHQVAFCRLVIDLGRSRRLSRVAYRAVRGPVPAEPGPRPPTETP